MDNKSKIIGLGSILIILNFYFRQRYLLSPLWTKPISKKPTAPGINKSVYGSNPNYISKGTPYR